MDEMVDIPPDLGGAEMVAYCAARQRPDAPYRYIPPGPESDAERCPRSRPRKPAQAAPEPLARRLERLKRLDERRLATWGRAEYALRLREQGRTWRDIGRAVGGVSGDRARQLAQEAERRRRRALFPSFIPCEDADDLVRVYLASLKDEVRATP